MLMTFYKKLLEYRLYIGIALVVACIPFFITESWNLFGWSLTFAFIAIGSHLFFGPMRLIQEAIQAGDMETAQKFIKTVHFPKLLFKPIRQGFYMLQSNIAMTNKDFDKAESLMKQSMKSKSTLTGEDNEGASYLQLGMIAMQNGKKGEARKNLMLAIKKGLPDIESRAAAYLQLSALDVQQRRFTQGRNFFKKAKQLKPKSKEIKEQITEMEKYIHRVR
ncbi:MAG: tetratricopeptide (TPR) repeat protein [Planctomycetota bacterium]|jgi:tetratricopeptide (TPR) repeat protein